MIIRKMEPQIEIKKKRVAAYCRVSTLREEQQESFEAQKRYYAELIKQHVDWEQAQIYTDRSSAISIKKRKGFQRMLADAQAKEIDIILCKSVSRFARNIVDCQKYSQWLISLGVTVIFEEQNIRTDDPTSSFILSMMSAIAQDESHSISKNVRASYKARFERGEYNLGNNRILGYDCKDGKLVPNRDAWIVEEIFKRFLNGQTCREIANGLAKMKIRTLHGKEQFSPETIRYMLSNETYVGDKLLQKQPPRDYLTKKPDFNQDFHSYYLKDDHDAIVTWETWTKVQAILKQKESNKKFHKSTLKKNI